MKALTICQPYAHLICLPDDDDRAKRVENRNHSKFSDFRGPLLIHAGKSREWLMLSEDETTDEDYEIPLAEMTFGAIVGVCKVVDFFNLEHEPSRDSIFRRRPWLKFHRHTEGKFCHVLAECRKFETPIPYRGAQGLFQVPNELVAEQLKAVGYA